VKKGGSFQPRLLKGRKIMTRKRCGDAVEDCGGGAGNFGVGLQGAGQKISTGQITAFFLYHVELSNEKNTRVQTVLEMPTEK
jgi:hypothetical protein